MLKRSILAAVATFALVAGTQAQEGATIVLRSGEKLNAQLVDMSGAGFTVRVNGQERQIGTNDVSVIDFTGNGDLSDADWARVGGGQTVWLRNGQTIDGSLYDIGGTTPLRITLRTSSGERNLSSNEIGRIVLARPGPTGTSGSGTPVARPIPEGGGVAVPGNQAWTPTGFTVRRGERVTFNATGEVQLSTDSNDLASASGARSQRRAQGAPIPDVYAGALIARVGNSAPFPIGGQQTVTMPADGQLFLGINDDQVADNNGGYRVNIQRGARR